MKPPMYRSPNIIMQITAMSYSVSKYVILAIEVYKVKYESTVVWIPRVVPYIAL